MKIFTKAFALDALNRAINTFVQTMLGVLAGVGLGLGGFETVQWAGVISVSGFAAFVSILNSVKVATSTTETVNGNMPASEDIADGEGRHRSVA